MRLTDPAAPSFAALYDSFHWHIPPRYNIAAALCDRHRQRDDVAIYWENDSGASGRCTFAALYRDANRLANALSGLGVQRGERVALLLPQRPETALTHLAAYKLGAVALPLSVLFGPDALLHRLKDSGARVLVTDRARYPLIESLRAELPELRHVLCCEAEPGALDFWATLARAADTFTTADTASADPALLIYTSGTTGAAKGALHAQRSLIGHLTGFELSHDFFPQAGDLFWTPADWAWAGGLLDALLPSLHYGVPILAYAGGRFDPERACALMAKYRVRNTFLPPTALKLLMQVPDIRRRHALDLRSIMSAGEMLGAHLLDWAQQALGVTPNEMWGQTECNYLVGNCQAKLPIRPGSMGKPYPGHTVAVIDENGQPVAAGVQGELAVRAGDPVLFLGYWQKPAATRDKFCGEWFRTGDVGYQDEDGYLWFVGRLDDVISSAGYRIGPGEIEDCLLKHPAVAQAAVIGVPDELRGQAVKACLVLKAGVVPSEALAEDIRQSVRTRLAAYEYPRYIEFLDVLPLTTTGKVRRTELRARHGQS